MAVAGSLTYETKLDTKGFKEGLNKVGSVAKGVAIGVGASITAIGAGLTAMIKKSIDSYAEYEQLVGGVESMFGGIEKGAEQINNVISKANGMFARPQNREQRRNNNRNNYRGNKYRRY